MLEHQIGLHTHHELQTLVEQLAKETRARAVVLVTANGNLLASSGETESVDVTALAALAAGSAAASAGLAGLFREPAFDTQFHEGKDTRLHIDVLTHQTLLVVVFDERTSLGLVRLRSRGARTRMNDLFSDTKEPSLAITDQELDALFGGV